jgi:hypothetical protein
MAAIAERNFATSTIPRMRSERGVASMAGFGSGVSAGCGTRGPVRLETFFRSSFGLPSGVEKVIASGISLRFGTAWQR